MQWRVGTFSMGLAMVLLGIGLFWQAVSGYHIVDGFAFWWPIIFILLGAEILIYLIFRKQQEGFVRYDLFSIFVVMVITTIGIGLVIVTSTGLMEEVKYAVHAEEEVSEISELHVELSPEVTRIIVSGSRYDYPLIRLSSTELNEIHMFGSLRQRVYRAAENSEPIEIADVHTIGNTAYLTFKTPGRKLGLTQESPHIDARLILPEHVEVLIDGGSGHFIIEGEEPPTWKVGDR